MLLSSRHQRLEVWATVVLAVVGVVACSGVYSQWARHNALNGRLEGFILWTNARGIRDAVRQGANPRLRAHTGRTILMVAAETGDLDLVEECLARGVEVDTAETFGLTALHHAVHEGADPALVELLLRYGADVHARTEAGDTPLHRAAYIGHSTVAKTLADRESDLHGPNTLRYTPLHCAAAAGHTSVISTLLEAGADVNVQVHGGPTPLSVAAQRSQLEVAEDLLSRGADVHRKASDGRSALDRAVEKRDEVLLTPYVQRAIERGSITVPDLNCVRMVKLLKAHTRREVTRRRARYSGRCG